jgi:hypothetical protein
MDDDLRQQLARRAAEEDKLREAGQQLRSGLPPDRWPRADVLMRMEFLSEAHDLLRPHFNLTQATTLAFCRDIDGGRTGGGFDEQTGRYILIAYGELTRDAAWPVLGALAEELRHAYQYEAVHRHVVDDRADRWRENFDNYDSETPLYQVMNEIEQDAERARESVVEGYLDAPQGG